MGWPNCSRVSADATARSIARRATAFVHIAIATLSQVSRASCSLQASRSVMRTFSAGTCTASIAKCV
jgi:hypothetical protein